ncbi:MAG: ABC transporter substrate-binding protein, partial [Candidatus Halalkalibacterium sp. M3_1C_030]
MMKLTTFARLPLFLLLAVLIASGCKGPETTVVRQNPITASPDTAATTDTTASEPSAAFRQINIGEVNPIPTLDPLFANNASTMRAVQLVYEGLVRFNSTGTVVPGIAKSWTVENDSLRYTFTLRNNVYYHDSNAFSNGVGRKLKAADVKYAFERMAQISVPEHAARLFMSIKGFEPYFREQHNVFNPAKRVLNGVSGIQTPNDTTVVFTLEDRDTPFLQKLASPYAVIYPREAITNNNPNQFKAVGAGPFTLSQTRGDTLYTFSKFKNYYQADQPVLNRVDVLVKKRESDLFKSFATRNIHVIPELGLQTMQGALNESGTLKSSYSENYQLAELQGTTRYSLNYNANADLIKEKARNIAELFDTTDTFGNLPSDLIRFETYSKYGMDTTQGRETAIQISTGDTLSITNTEDS